MSVIIIMINVIMCINIKKNENKNGLAEPTNCTFKQIFKNKVKSWVIIFLNQY